MTSIQQLSKPPQVCCVLPCDKWRGSLPALSVLRVLMEIFDESPQPTPFFVNELRTAADDWETIEIWLGSIESRSRHNSPETVATYRYHLTKLRWYCEHVAMKLPSEWTLKDCEAFSYFLRFFPSDALCARDGMRFVKAGEAGWTPFHRKPSDSARVDIERCAFQLFRLWHEAGYIQTNPMFGRYTYNFRKANGARVIESALSTIVLEAIRLDQTANARSKSRDYFVFTTLFELGLRLNELLGVTMNMFQCLTDPSNSKTYWVLHVNVPGCWIQGRRERWLPVPRTVIEALRAYREAFGFSATPCESEDIPLVLSLCPRPDKGQLSVTTRMGLHTIVKGRLTTVANQLEADGDLKNAAALRHASTGWLRNAFAKTAWAAGYNHNELAGLLGTQEFATARAYNETEALDLVRAYERVTPGRLALESPNSQQQC